MSREIFSTTLLLLAGSLAGADQPLPGTKPLTRSDDIASSMVDGIDRFLLERLDQADARRAERWNTDTSSPEAHEASLVAKRELLAHQLGVRDKRVPAQAPVPSSPVDQSPVLGASEAFEAIPVRWSAFADVHGEGLLLVPKGNVSVANVVAIPDAAQTPEQLAGLDAGTPPEQQFARRLAESGCRVLIPALVNRELRPSPRAIMSNREFVYRAAYELGRHLLGYEIQKVLAGVDWFAETSDQPIGVVGYGEGGFLALAAGALDPRIDAVLVSGYFGSRTDLWKEPMDRNIFGFVRDFGAAELAAMIAPRPLVIEAGKAPTLVLESKGGAPGELTRPADAEVRKEFALAKTLAGSVAPKDSWKLLEPGAETFGSPEALRAFLHALNAEASLAELGSDPSATRSVDNDARQERLTHELDRHNQWLLSESPYVREEYFKDLDTSSMESFRRTIEPYREAFRKDVIGEFDEKLSEPNPRTRRFTKNAKWTGYEVVLDVFPDVIAYGLLLVPNDLKAGEERPVVVCQHGLEGRPQPLVSGNHRAYKDFAAKLADRGFVVFCPQNPYIFKDRFRTLQRKSYLLGKTLFSTIVPQHQRITDWLASLPFVDGDRIGFYGLSYGGKTAMRVPPLVDNYALSICSGDFNEWVDKNASTRRPTSYMFTGEYEIFEFDLGSTFNYAEMAYLIAPRPFMVERGHFDGVARDDTVGSEFGKVRFLYNAKLGIGDRAEIEWFPGPHAINGVGTFDFLHKHLDWPKRD
ncbi:Alpha/beta hydrolase family protein [Planctomycetes bacterium Pan216]|uniref:Alpha/beta hydrolase family protein n=1 Tax=Kolteria novifilia TaxID=2527975 RepID=A0A518B013_9BACT|nr:Alpha/beta hydrolase family protein [Planctomycetes bacterium Pan216]